ncbi:hypothetical protein Tco_0418570 [Tanacetum coccineum]
MLQVFPFTLTKAVKRWVDRLAPGTINTWDLFKKALSKGIAHLPKPQVEDIHKFTQEGDESLYQAWERYNDLLYKCPTHDINSHQKDDTGPSSHSNSDHDRLAQKWHDGTRSRNIRSSNSNDRLDPLINKLDNLGRDMKKLKESVHAILDAKFAKDLTSTRIIPSTRKLNKLKRSDMENLDEQRLLTGTIEENFMNIKSEQAKVVIVEHEGPYSPKKLKNLHGISFLSDSQEENTNDQLPMKESNPGHFRLPCTIDNFNIYAMADVGASVNVLPRNIFEYLKLTNLSETEMLVEMADMRKKAPLRIVRDILVKIDKFLFPFDFIILDQTPNSTVIGHRSLPN